MTENPPLHSIIGASSAKRWINCTASIDLCASVPSSTTKYADEGTKAHTIAEKFMRGEKVPHGEMRENAEIYNSVIMQAYMDAVDPGEIHYESRVSLKALADNAFGTVDAWFYDSKTLILYVFDYKYGSGELIDVKGNEQLLYYAAAVKETFNLKPFFVSLNIIQPRMGNISTDLVFVAVVNDFVDGALEALSKPKVFKDGDHCRWCDAKFKCPIKLKQISDIVGSDIQAKLTKHMLRSPSDMTEVEILTALENANLLSSWISSVRAYAQNFVQLGGTLPGYSLEETIGNRKYVDESEVIKLFGDLLSTEELYSMKLKTPAQLEKLIPKELKKTLETLTTREVTGIKLKHTQTNNNEAQSHLFKSFNSVSDYI